MSDDMERYVLNRAPSADRPLQGMTVLVVEDSRFASEAIRLLCLRSGARIRRADSLAAAHRHLAVYRPSIILVDMGLPDGSGADLIHELAQATPRVAVLMGISGDDDAQALAMEAGADGFMAKPIESLAQFQQSVLAHLPAGEGPTKPRALPTETVSPDPVAFQDDLTHVADVINQAPDGRTLDYIAQFLSGVARTAHDYPLEAAAVSLAQSRANGRGTGSDVARVAGIVQERLQSRVWI
ncbi:response regulator [Aliiroseovarius subalbicans]|uniref:response regulator n=1 Tax=Aliiroseovarius subalbicans TaxID=2925840 RepID=UPI001F59D354|nr:response regulator [Aliiroseovarius subalbicans]MCI2400373.1 response regulator [Aliiroseovarius subalbicans]